MPRRAGLRVKPAGYVAVLFGGKAEHLLRGVDFYVGDSGEPYCDSDSGIVERVPGFGGAFRDSDQNIVYIYVQDASMQEEAERALTEEFGPDFLAGREVQVLKGEYSMDHLDAWYRTLSGAISQVPGILYTDLDEGRTASRSSCTHGAGGGRRPCCPRIPQGGIPEPSTSGR